MENIGVIGLGYVGLTFSIVAALKKFNVYGIEVNQATKLSIKQNKAHFYEPGIDNLLRLHQGKNFFVEDGFVPEQNLDAILVTVGTPLVNNGAEPNFQYILSALDTIADIYDGSQLIILRSTVSVGTTRKIVLPYLSQKSGKPVEELLVAFCPERTVEGKAISELQNLPQIVGGNNLKSLAMAEDLFRQITPFVVRVDSLEAAELIKLFNNTYRDIHFSIGNAFNEIAQKFGLNGIQLIKDANMGYERSNIAAPGFVGGPCLSKDAYILTYNLEDFKGKDFVINSRKYNESLEETIVDWVCSVSQAKGLDRKIGISGLAFKGVPETSDLRGSNAVSIAYKLKQLGFTLYLHDFVANKTEMQALGLGEVRDDLYELSADVDCLLLLNNNRAYRNVDIIALSAGAQNKKIVLDTWGALEAYSSELGDAQIFNLGNMLI